MSFLDELKQDIVQGNQAENASSCPATNQKRFQEYVREELSSLQQLIKKNARRGQYQVNGDKHVFKGIRLWHEGDYRHGTGSLANFYSFLARDTILDRVVVSQRKKLIGGYSYEVQYSLSKDGAAYFELFTQEFAKEGIKVSGLFILKDNGSTAPLPLHDRGSVKYDFELEHHLINYPRLCYTYELEV